MNPSESDLYDGKPVWSEVRPHVVAVPRGPGGGAEEWDGEGQEGGVEGGQHAQQMPERGRHVQVAGSAEDPDRHQVACHAEDAEGAAKHALQQQLTQVLGHVNLLLLYALHTEKKPLHATVEHE